jgi:hypothetical protein
MILDMLSQVKGKKGDNMRVSQYLKRLEKGNWLTLMHHRSKTTKSEIRQSVIHQLQQHLHWLKVGLKTIPDKEISQVITTAQAKELLNLMLDNTPRSTRIHQLDEELRTLTSSIDKIKSEKENDRKNLGKIKSLKRKSSILQKEYDELNSSVDERRLAIARYAAEYGIECIIREYGAATRGDKVAMKEIEPLDDNKKLLLNIVKQIPKRRYLLEKEREWERMHPDKR